MTNKEAIRVLKTYDNSLWGGFPLSKVTMLEVEYAIDSAIEALGETKLIKNNEVWTDEITYDFYVTECCKIGPITTEKFCSECGKKIIK